MDRFSEGELLILLTAYLLLLVLTMGLLYRGQQRAYVVVKTMTSLLFVVTGVLGTDFVGENVPLQVLFLAGLVLCMAGDVALALGHEIDNRLTAGPFRKGVLFFLLAHVCFVLAILRLAGPGLLVLSAFILGSVLTPFIVRGNLKSPAYDYQGHGTICYIYSYAVGALGGTGAGLILTLFFGTRPELPGGGAVLPVLGAGCILFLLSDLVLSIKLFYTKKWKGMPALVLILYYGATMLLALSIGYL